MVASFVTSISTYLVETLTTVLSTLYSTSTPLSVTMITSTLSQLDTLQYLTTITQPATVILSTTAIPLTITETASTAIVQSSVLPVTTNSLTTTVTSFITDSNPTVTWYASPASPPSMTITQTAEPTSELPSTSVITITKVALVLEDDTGTPYTTIITILPNSPEPTGGMVIVHDLPHGWNAWSTSQRAGLVVGVGLFAMIMLLLVSCLLMRRRTMWLASDWAPWTPYGNQMVQPVGRMVPPR